jgi:Ran GTPase-activating protein (RanGAP) involved in mRNA processing and transport
MQRSNPAVGYLLAYIADTPLLETLTMSTCTVGCADLRLILQQIRERPLMRVLIIRNVTFTEDAEMLLLELLPTLSHITTLQWCQPFNDARTVNTLLETVQQCRNITDLSLKDNGACFLGFSDTIRLLGMCTQLTSLSLDGNCITPANTLPDLARALPQLTKLRHLDMRRCAMAYHGITEFAPILPAICQLTSLNLSHNNISDKGVVKLAAVLPRCLALEKLDLSNNAIYSIGVRDLMAVIPACPMMQSLNLSNNLLLKRDIPRMTKCLAQCPLLIQFIIDGNNLMGPECMPFISQLQANVKLQTSGCSQLYLILSSNRRRRAHPRLPPELYEMIYTDFISHAQ